MTFQDRIPLYVAAFAAVLVAIGFAAGVSKGIGALVGAAVAIVNAFALRWMVSAIAKVDPRKRAGVSLLLMLKTGAILAVSAAILFFGHIDPVGFALGIGALVLGLVVGSVHVSLSEPTSPSQPTSHCQPSGLARKGD
jgi:hypothetical protein